MGKTIGISLSGGALRGIFHLGVLEALDELKMVPDIIAGTSSGAIIGALYLTGMSPKDILKMSQNSSLLNMINIKAWRGGFLSLKYLQTLLEKHLRHQRLEELPKPLLVTATNINSGKLEVFEEGEIIPIVMASSSVPVLFNPIRIGDAKYLDGGLMMNLPASPIRSKCDVLIGVNLIPVTPIDNDELNSLLKVGRRTFDLAVLNNIKPEIGYCDLVITSERLQNKGRFDFARMSELFDLGYEACMAEEEKLRALVQAH